MNEITQSENESWNFGEQMKIHEHSITVRKQRK